jgi:hypothetical protein
MAWSTMHFAVGMACAGAAAAGTALALRRGWRWVPAAMTLGGVWALIPDLPRTFREDVPNATFAAVLGSKALDHLLHDWGDLFFFHRALDTQPKEYALLGMGIILLLYNAAIAGLMWAERRQRNSPANRAYRAHERLRHRHRHHRRVPPDRCELPEAGPLEPADAVLHRIRPAPSSLSG